MDKLNVPVLLGTAREGRQSEKVAKFMVTEVQKFGFDSQLVDVKDFLFGKTLTRPNPDTRWAEIMKKASGLIIVSPEYNYGYPGELKILLDSIYDEYAGKPVVICGVSGGVFGGSRMQMNLEPILIELQMTVLHPTLYFGTVQNLFDEQGQIKDTTYQERAQALFQKIVDSAKKLA